MVGILEIGLENLEAVDLGGNRRRNRCLRRIASRRHVARRTRGIGLNAGRQSKRADVIAALTQGMNVTVHCLEALERRALDSHQMVVHALEVLGDEKKSGFRQQMVNVGNPAGQRIFDRNHRQRRFTRRDRFEGRLEIGLRQHRHPGIDVAAGEVRIGTGVPLKRNGIRGIVVGHRRLCRAD